MVYCTFVEAIGGVVELLVGEAPPGGLIGRRVDVDALLGALVGVAPAAEGQEPLQAPAPEVIHLAVHQAEQEPSNGSADLQLED
jgi:hypothetical protein